MRKQLVLAFGSIFLAFLIIVSVEGVLRVVGMGAPPANHVSRLGYQQVALPLLSPATRADGTEMLRPTDTRLPFQSIARAKPPGTLRVFAFGGSATAGLGYSPNVTFPRYLEQMLRAAAPDASLELVNLGIVALSSSQVATMVEQVCAHYEPDLLIVYSGNNEFLEVHAQKYADKTASFGTKVRAALASTNVFRLLSPLVRPKAPVEAMTNRDLAASELRLTEDVIIKEISLSAAEVTAIGERYEFNMERIAAAALARDVPLALMTVASNWEWRGREDIETGYFEQLVDEPGLTEAELQQRALTIISGHVTQAEGDEVHEWLFRRATLRRAMGNHVGAREDYRASMNADPHLRRALDAMNGRARRVAKRPGVALVDSVELLANSAEHGVVGFAEFYDYVHLTPRGALLLAAALYNHIESIGLIPDVAAAFSASAFVSLELARVASLSQDDYSVDTWLGFGFEPERIVDRNLWKYDEMVTGFDERLEQDPGDVSSLIYRGNARFHELGGASKAAADYRAALAAIEALGEGGNSTTRSIRSNLTRLLAERPAETSGDQHAL